MKELIGKQYSILLLVVFFSCLGSCTTDNDFPSEDDNPYSVVNKYQDGEENLTDDLSVATTNNNAFGLAVVGLTDEQTIHFASGNSLFNQSWVTAPASTSGLDGLGPIFNARSCAGCHFKDGRGKPFEESRFGSKGFLMRLSVAGTDENGGPKPHPVYGSQLQNHAILNVPREAKVKTSFTTISGKYPDGTAYELRKPNYIIYDENFGSLSGVLISPRVAQQTIGLGLIGALSEEEILKNVDETDANNDGISGRANYVWNIEEKRNTIGKYGWKANTPTLKQQIAAAFHGDIGLTTSMFSQAPCPSPQQDCYEAPNGGSPEVTDKQLSRVLLYQRTLAVPKRRNYTKQNVLDGKVLFHKINCVACHQTNFITSNDAALKVLRNKKISPFSDFLLHDMGEGLADNRPDFLANGREWRTQPLWGIGLIKTVNKHTFLLHDGRARNVEEAILWHGGEAERSLNQFKNLTQLEREQVIAYINSL